MQRLPDDLLRAMNGRSHMTRQQRQQATRLLMELKVKLFLARRQFEERQNVQIEPEPPLAN